MQAEISRILLLLLLASAAAAGATPPATAADGLGRLFLTPGQRQALDAARGQADGATDTPPPAVAAPPRPEQLLLSGVLTRSRGPDVVWVNAAPAAGPARVRSGPDATPRVTLADPAAGATATLKPGQVWSPRTGRVSDCLGCTAAAPQPPADVPPAEPAGTSTAAPAPATAAAATAAAEPAASTTPPPASAGQP